MTPLHLHASLLIVMIKSHGFDFLRLDTFIFPFLSLHYIRFYFMIIFSYDMHLFLLSTTLLHLVWGLNLKLDLSYA